MAKVGRPSKFTQEVVDTICSRIANGESLRKICLDEDMPHRDTVNEWLSVNEVFSDQYVRAREEQADFMGESILEIADDTENDLIDVIGDGGEVVGTKVNSEHISRSRLRVDTRKWLMSKMAPKKYGDKITQEHTSPGGGPVQVQTIFAPVGKDHDPSTTD